MVLLIIKIVIALGLICLLRIMIWRESKTNSFHCRVRLELGSNAVMKLNYFTFVLLGLGLCIVVFSFPRPLGLIIGGVLGLIGALMGM